MKLISVDTPSGPVYNVSEQDARSVFCASDAAIDAARAATIKDALRAKVRDQIDVVADAKSREGVMSDVLGVVVVGLAQLTVALSKAKTIADVNAAAQPLADIGSAVDAAVKSGALKLPYMVKTGGAAAVLADMTKLANGVSEVLASAQAQTQSQAK